jgi:hypothetical protein
MQKEKPTWARSNHKKPINHHQKAKKVKSLTQEGYCLWHLVGNGQGEQHG